jgi:hypothetical protein
MIPRLHISLSVFIIEGIQNRLLNPQKRPKEWP